MYKIVLMNEFLHGPIWIYDEEGMIRRKYPIITEDGFLMALNEEAGLLYDECYSFDNEDSPCLFDESCYQKNRSRIKEIVNKIIIRLNEVNDGSFCIENRIE